MSRNDAPSRTSHPTRADILRSAADLIAKPGAWTQGAFARTEKGRVIGPDTKNATCWCAAGAIYRMSPGAMAPGLIDDVSKGMRKYGHLAAFNDEPGRTQGEVVAKLRQVAYRLDRATPNPNQGSEE